MLASKFEYIISILIYMYVFDGKNYKKLCLPYKILILNQVRVKYSVTPYVNDSSEVNHYIAEDQWRDLSRIDMMEEKMHEDTPLLVNIKGKMKIFNK